MEKAFKRNNTYVMLSEMDCIGNDGKTFRAVSYEKYLVQDNRLYLADEYTYIETPIDRVVEILIQNGYTDITYKI